MFSAHEGLKDQLLQVNKTQDMVGGFLAMRRRGDLQSLQTEVFLSIHKREGERIQKCDES